MRAMQVYRCAVNAIYVLLASSVCAVAGCLPLLAAWALVPGFDWYLPFCLAGALSAPGVAALFAVFRDHPALRPEAWPILAGRGSGRRPERPDDERRPDWIAAPYVPADVDVAVFRPYWRAYVRLFARSLRLGVPAFALVAVLCYDMQLLLQVAWGALLIPVALVLAVMAVATLVVALCLTVAYPKATWVALVRNGVVLAVRRLPMTAVGMLALLAYGYGLAHSPFLVLTLATGPVAYLVWAGARWQAQPLAAALAPRPRGPEPMVSTRRERL
ncbi:hypothetical protein H7U32_06850 [Bifidobacterium pullorum subsp. saeculare]|uniref:DUF624 domain-containing protein n=1 Tax=Bifidobacterium pullorum subsp. saeculare TaxID=78257 RepID=A0A939BA05_9BIFI|nr:hypothetical protein [Bifidobacterium pullorum]MBM6700024.1 hypothetical protein [Bifidobacterium pullorum subsp. saeculare]